MLHYVVDPLKANPLLTETLVPFGTLGGGGVKLFFVLSGFLISGILIDNKNSKSFFRTFYIRRFCRILPLYFLVFGACLLALAFHLPDRMPICNSWLVNELMPLLSYATFTQNFFMAMTHTFGGNWLAMTWSLAIEEQFYLLFPLIAYFSSGFTLACLSLICVVFAPMSYTILLEFVAWPYPLLPIHLPSLAMGVMIACIVRQPVLLENFQKRKRGVAIFCILLFVATILHAPTADRTIPIFFGVTLFWILLSPKSLLTRFCRAKWLQFIGLISYGVYMFHQPISGLFHAMLANQVPVLLSGRDASIFLAAFLTTIATASLSYFAMEKRFLAIGQKAKW